MYRGSRESSPSASGSRLTRLFTVSGLTTRPGQTCVIKDSLLSTFGAARTNATRSWNDRLGKAMSLPARVTSCCPTSTYRSPTLSVPGAISGMSRGIWFIDLSGRSSQDACDDSGLTVKMNRPVLCARAANSERADRPCLRSVTSAAWRLDQTPAYAPHHSPTTLTAAHTKAALQQGCPQS